MNIQWLTGRRLGCDLASSTEIGIFNALRSRGVNLQLHYPGATGDKPSKMEGVIPTMHNSKIRGLKSRLASRSAASILREASKDSDSIIMVDWRLIPWLRSELTRYPSKWFLIDRGPPADNTILGWMQWRYWAKSWKIARDIASGGFVVSEGHEQLVRHLAGEELPICQIGGGVRRGDIVRRRLQKNSEALNLVYVGRIDKNRGVIDFFEILNWAEKNRISLNVHIAGEGDKSNALRRDPRVTHHGMLERDKILPLLSKCDIGLLPMPPRKVWSTSSPLKLAEYAAAGLAVIGVKHPGHELPGSSGWMELGDKDDWWIDGILRFKDMNDEDWNLVHNSATASAEALTFENLAERLDGFLSSVC